MATREVPSATAGRRRLYGRADALRQLLGAYDRFLERGSQQRELVLISGQGGVGKTTLACSLKERVLDDNGFFLQGKFDESLASSNSSPSSTYEPFLEAITEFCNQAIDAGDDFMHSLRRSLLTSMSSSELDVVQQTVPKVANISGLPITVAQQQTRRIALRGADAEERFSQIFSKFLATISSQGFPIVLLLDDVQWSSQNANALVRAAAGVGSKDTSCQLLVICTCRNEDSSLLDTVRLGLQSEDYHLTCLDLPVLSLPAVHELLEDKCFAGEASSLELAEIVFNTTDGNPFHVLQLVDEIQHRNCLNGSSGTTGSEINAMKIFQGLDRKQSVMQLIRQRLQRLPEKAKEVLKVASCIGSAFYEECLKAGVLFPSSVTISAIRCIQAEGILVSCSNPHKLRFTHDKFRRESYMMITKSDREAFHLDVGRRLWQLLPLECRDEHLLTVADQMSHAVRLIRDRDEKIQVARLFLQAGQKAAYASSFTSAAEYLRLGISLLGSRHWTKQYKLSLALHNTAAEIEYYCGNLSRVDELVKKIVESAKSFDDTLVARFTRIYCLGSRNEMAQALADGFVVLQRLGVRLPRLCSSFQAGWDLWFCERILRRKTQQGILELPALTDTKKLTIIRLMTILHSFALLSSAKCVPMIAARTTRLTLQYGLHEVSCAGFANLGLFYAFQGNVEESYRCSQLALSLQEKYGGNEWQGRISFSIHACISPLKRPLRESIPCLLEGHQAGLVSGDISFSMLCAFMYCRIRLLAGDSIQEVLAEAKSYRDLASKYCQHFCFSHFDTLIQFCLNLIGDVEDPLVLTGDGIDEAKALQTWETKSLISYLGVLIAKHFIAVHMSNFALADKLARKIRMKRAGNKLVPFLLHNHLFHQAVASAALSRTSRAHKQQALRLLAQLQASAKHCPENYLHRVYLVEAELLASSPGDCRDDAIAKYRMSIDLAKRQGIVPEHALACDRAGLALLGCGNQSNDEAINYLEQSHSLYQQWGAHTKADQLTNNLAHLQAARTGQFFLANR